MIGVAGSEFGYDNKQDPVQGPSFRARWRVLRDNLPGGAVLLDPELDRDSVSELLKHRLGGLEALADHVWHVYRVAPPRHTAQRTKATSK